jgi:hypothetical protein
MGSVQARIEQLTEQIDRTLALVDRQERLIPILLMQGLSTQKAEEQLRETRAQLDTLRSRLRLLTTGA